MGLYDEFRFEPCPWLPHSGMPLEELERIRNIKREDMEYTNENGFSVKVLLDPREVLAQDIFLRILLSDRNDTPLTMILPNQMPDVLASVAESLNRFSVSARNLHVFAIGEWADEDGNVAPLSCGAGVGYSLLNHFYALIREDLRPPVDHWHLFTNENKADGVYSRMLEDMGGADVVYEFLGWAGRAAFIDSGCKEFQANSLEEYCQLGSRIASRHPLSFGEHAMIAPTGSSGDVWAVPSKAATIGPRDLINAKERLIFHESAYPDCSSWQRMMSRLALYGPVSMEVPASILRLGKGVCYVSETIARPFRSWYYGIEDRHCGVL